MLEEVTVVRGQPLYLSCELNKERKRGLEEGWQDCRGETRQNCTWRHWLYSWETAINDADDSDAGTYTVTVEKILQPECSSCVKVVGQCFAGKLVLLTVQKEEIFSFQYQNINSLTPYLPGEYQIRAD